MVHGKWRGPLSGRESFPFHRHDPRDPVMLARYLQGGARCTEGGFWWGCLPRACRAPRLGRTPARRGSDKSRLLGASPPPPPRSSIRKGGPAYGWKNRGIFAVGRTGRRGLRVSSNLAQ